jgi:DNA-directed RNA polymerase subunit beta'
VGRALLSEILPKGLPFSQHQQGAEEEGDLALINTSFRKCGLKETVVLADKLLQKRLPLATRAGISIAIDDMLVPKEKHGPDRARREGSQGDRAAVRLGPGDRRRALQQGGRHLGQDR